MAPREAVSKYGYTTSAQSSAIWEISTVENLLDVVREGNWPAHGKHMHPDMLAAFSGSTAPFESFLLSGLAFPRELFSQIHGDTSMVICSTDALDKGRRVIKSLPNWTQDWAIFYIKGESDNLPTHDSRNHLVCALAEWVRTVATEVEEEKTLRETSVEDLMHHFAAVATSPFLPNVRFLRSSRGFRVGTQGTMGAFTAKPDFILALARDLQTPHFFIVELKAEDEFTNQLLYQLTAEIRGWVIKYPPKIQANGTFRLNVITVLETDWWLLRVDGTKDWLNYITSPTRDVSSLRELLTVTGYGPADTMNARVMAEFWSIVIGIIIDNVNQMDDQNFVHAFTTVDRQLDQFFIVWGHTLKNRSSNSVPLLSFLVTI